MVRLAVQSSSTALLPAHLKVISQCWDESLLKAPIPERVRLISFLIQLRPHFPSWKGILANILSQTIIDNYLFSVLSWDVIVETLMEYDYDPRDGGERIHSFIGRASGHLFSNVNDSDLKDKHDTDYGAPDPETTLLRV